MKKRIVILGAGESGTGAALLAQAKGYDVFVSDSSEIKSDYKEALVAAEITFEEGKHTVSAILNTDLVVKSPGIAPSVSIVKQLDENEILVIDEIEFAATFTKGKIIAITGTNGKTTTTMLTYHLLKQAGCDVAIAGNIGTSMAAQLIERDYDWWVIEMSSFQIDGILTFKPDIAVLLNISPDHLDRYEDSMAQYVQSKFNLFQAMKAEDNVIINQEDTIIKKKLAETTLTPNINKFGLQQNEFSSAYLTDEELVIKYKQQEIKIDLNLLSFRGSHNIQNAMASILSAKLAGLKTASIKESLPKFKNAQHRMELISSLHGVDFINDSKATNVDAVYYALDAFTRPVIWIVGGVDKGNDYSKLLSVSSNVKAIICLGKDNAKIKAFFSNKFGIIEETQSMDEAVRIGYKIAKDREVVLLSPACASFDLFKSYEDRGNQFRMAVQLLERELALKEVKK